MFVVADATGGFESHSIEQGCFHKINVRIACTFAVRLDPAVEVYFMVLAILLPFKGFWGFVNNITDKWVKNSVISYLVEFS